MSVITDLYSSSLDKPMGWMMSWDYFPLILWFCLPRSYCSHHQQLRGKCILLSYVTIQPKMQGCMTGSPYAPLSHSSIDNSSFLPALKYASFLLYKPYAQGECWSEDSLHLVPIGFSRWCLHYFFVIWLYFLGFCNIPTRTRYNNLAT